MRRSKQILCVACFLLLVGGTVRHAGASPAFAGTESCVECHETEYRAWRGSHHDLAMQHATEETVLGDFTNAEFTHQGVTSTFFRREGKFMVRTDGPDGALQDFEIAYAFGVEPLQQYLVAFPDGRLQALGIAWDTRPAEAGGQRWFHVYPDEPIDHQDPLHWTGALQNWNYMCADCHSTGLVKGYDPEQDRFETTWSEIDVGCEACHGPGEAHLDWAAARGEARGGDDDRGLVVQLRDRVGVTWSMDPQSGNARRQGPGIGRREVEVCAACHSRRGQFAEGVESEPRFLEHYLPALLTEELYFHDGQIQDEVYVWGSFLQSRMYAAGVTCSDCHDPHSQKLNAPGDGVCAQCHAPATYAVETHTHHAPESTGADCLGCHMPARDYMVVDPRRDHSLRIPRPDLSLEFGTPNACTQCHADRDDRWAAAQFAEWYPEPKEPYQDWTRAFHQARSGRPQAEVSLLTVINDEQTPDIARATAVLELRNHLGPLSAQVLRSTLRDESPLVRMATIRTLEAVPPDQRLGWLGDSLTDPARVVRMEAARLLAAAPARQFDGATTEAMRSALAEFEAAQRYNADRAEAQFNLANLYADMGDAARAERQYRRAMQRDSSFTPARLNLAELYRNEGMNREAEATLREGIEDTPGDASLHHALGLALVRAGRKEDALPELETAARLAPEAARYAYVYAVAQHSAGAVPAALATLRATHERHPTDRPVLVALVNYHAEAGDREAAIGYARKLAALNPADPQAAELLRRLEGDG